MSCNRNDVLGGHAALVDDHAVSHISLNLLGIPTVATVLATIEGMIAVVWHFWLGLILLVVGGLAVVQLVVGYVAKVSAMKYPNRRQRNAQK